MFKVYSSSPAENACLTAAGLPRPLSAQDLQQLAHSILSKRAKGCSKGAPRGPAYMRASTKDSPTSSSTSC